MKTEIKTGDIVIVNEFDAPCDKLLAIVVQAHDGEGLYHYLNLGYCCKGPIKDATRIQDFGRDMAYNWEKRLYVTAQWTTNTVDGRHWQNCNIPRKDALLDKAIDRLKELGHDNLAALVKETYREHT